MKNEAAFFTIEYKRVQSDAVGLSVVICIEYLPTDTMNNNNWITLFCLENLPSFIKSAFLFIADLEVAKYILLFCSNVLVFYRGFK